MWSTSFSLWIFRTHGLPRFRCTRLQRERYIPPRQTAQFRTTHASLARGKLTIKLQMCSMQENLFLRRFPFWFSMRMVWRHCEYYKIFCKYVGMKRSKYGTIQTGGTCISHFHQIYLPYHLLCRKLFQHIFQFFPVPCRLSRKSAARVHIWSVRTYLPSPSCSKHTSNRGSYGGDYWGSSQAKRYLVSWVFLP